MINTMFTWLKSSLLQGPGKDAIISVISGAALMNGYETHDPTVIGALITICAVGLIGVLRYVIRRRERKQLDVEMLNNILQVLETISRDPEIIAKIAKMIDKQLKPRSNGSEETKPTEPHTH